MSDMGQFRNGADVHFDYTGERPPVSTGSKKKKKKRLKAADAPTVAQAHLTNPNDDYPTLRVIKQAANGDVIVELLDDPEPLPAPDHAIWDQLLQQEQENLKAFWELLDQQLKMKLVKIDKKLILEMFRRNAQRHDQSHGHNHHHHHHHSQALLLACTCKYCGRRNNVIEDELDLIYENHFDDIIDFIHEVRDINDLNALPGLLFGGFHMLEEEHRLQKRQQQQQLQQQKQLAQAQVPQQATPPTHDSLPQPPQQQTLETPNGAVSLFPRANPADQIPTQLSVEEQRVFKALLDPKLFEALETLDFEKLKDVNDINRASLLQKAGSLRDIIRDFHRADKVHLEKGMLFLQNMSKLFNSVEPPLTTGEEPTQAAANIRQFSQGLSLFAEDLLKNDGHSFIEMMELLLELRTEREDLLKELVEEDADGNQIVPAPAPQPSAPAPPPPAQEYALESELFEDEEESEGLEDASDEALCVLDTELEILEEEKMQEIRRLFLIQVIKLFQERLKNAYKEKLAEDRTNQLIQELEAEELAKKERELKKQKQKEKQREKKRLLQLAKEEERKRQEEERLKEEEELKQRQEAQRAEQKRKKEEKQQKREEEKRKRIEELKRKEEEHRKRVEAQQKKEEEAKRLKEERKRKAEEEKAKQEEEKRQKELERKQREEQRERERIERERREAEEEASELQRQTEEVAAQFQQEIATQQQPTAQPVLSQPLPTSTAQSSFPFLAQPLPIVLLTRLGAANAPNHLLDQLYLLTPTAQFAPIAKLLPLPPPGLGGSQPLPFPATLGSLLPWNIHATPVTSSPGLFLPFGEPFGSDVFTAQTPLAQRKLIWGQPTPSATRQPLFSTQTNLWNPGSMPSVPSAPAAAAPVAASAAPTNPQELPMVLAVAGGDAEVIQLATYNAFHMLTLLNQLEFGMAPLHKLFNQVRTLVGAQLSLGQFLTLIRTLQQYQFDVVYDDVGTVTHVKVTQEPQASSGLAQVPPATNPLPQFGQPNLLNSFAPQLSRLLWN